MVGISRRAPQAETTGDLLDGLLGSPASTELRLRVQALLVAGDTRGAVESIVTSDEFARIRLPGLVASSSSEWSGQSVFFLHVPKTSGVSTRIALAEAIGVPPVYSLNLPGDVPPRSWKGASFWPFFAAHAHIDAFPESHIGVTTIREPRSRLLSLYRQHQSSDPDTLRLLSPQKRERRMSQAQAARSLDLASWLRTANFTPMVGLFASGHRITDRTFALKASTSELRACVEVGLERIHHAAWSHRTSEVEDMIHTLSGRRIALGHHNVRHIDGTAPRDVLDREAMDQLEQLSRRDFILIEAAQDKGLVPPLSQEEADEQFETSARRLGFVL